MFTTLLIKEMHENIITGKFIIASILCLVLIPLGMYVTLKEYEQRNSDYLNAERLYEERSEGTVGATFKAEGYRPPSALSVFASGLEQFLPNKAVTSDSRYAYGESLYGMVNISNENESPLHNPLSLLFGKLDFLTITGTVLSIFVMISTFSLVTGEREQGTLKMILSNRVPRWSVLLAKIAGNFPIFLIPFLISVCAGLILLTMTGSFPLNSPGTLTSIIVIVSVTILFFICIYTLGILVSTLMPSSTFAIVTLLLIWTMFTMVIPKLSPMIVQVIRPVQSYQAFTTGLEDTRTDIKNELFAREDELFLDIIGRHGITVDEYFDIDKQSAERVAIESEYDAVVGPIRDDYASRLVQASENYKRNFDNALREQERLSMLISRISPVSCFTYLVTNLAGTGLLEIDKFTSSAEQFQDEVAATVYDKFDYMQYGTHSRGYNMGFREKDGVDQGELSVPRMVDYRSASFSEAFGESWPDLLLLALYTVLFFAGAFVKFLRYDVR